MRGLAMTQALAHPMRHRLLLALGAAGATVSQLSRRLDTNKGNVAHHLEMLRRAGLARITGTHTVRGGTARTYGRVGSALQLDGGRETTTAMLAAVADGVLDDPGEPLLHLRHLRLTGHQAQHLAKHLDRLVSDLPTAAATEPLYGVFVSVYRASPPGT